MILPRAEDLSETTTYCHGGFNKLLVNSNNGLETYEVVIEELGPTPITAAGSRDGNNLLLQVVVGDFTLDYDVNISSDDSTMTAAIDVSIPELGSILINEYGTLDDCAAFDLDTQAVPQVVTADFTNVADYIEDISLFRSAADTTTAIALNHVDP